MMSALRSAKFRGNGWESGDLVVPSHRTDWSLRRNVAKARFLGNDPSKCVLNKLQASQIQNRCASKERVTVIEPRTHYRRSNCLASFSGEGRSNVTECANVKVRCLACFGNLFVKRHLRVKMNTQIFDWWLELDGWTSNWNGFNGFSQGFERFGPWVEKSNGLRLGWIEVKTIVQMRHALLSLCNIL